MGEGLVPLGGPGSSTNGRRAKSMTSLARRLSDALRLATLQARAQSLATLLPRPLRFLAVGGLGLAANITLFSIVWMLGLPSLTAGLLALIAATVLTWRLNRAFTFDRS